MIKELTVIFSVCAALFLLIPTDAYAQFEVAITQGNLIIVQGIRLLKAMAIIAVLAVAAMTMTGKVPWGWGFAIIGALILLSMVQPGDDEFSIQNWILNVSGANTAGNLEAVTSAVVTELNPDTFSPAAAVTGTSLADDMENIIKGFAGAAIVAMAIVGFSGRFPFKWLMAIVGGLVVMFVGEQFVSDAVEVSNQEDAVRGLFTGAEQVAETTYLGGRTVIYGFGALATIGLGISAMMGQWRWSVAFSVVAGLVVIAALQGGLTYLTGEGAVLTQNDNVRNIALPATFTTTPTGSGGLNPNAGTAGSGTFTNSGVTNSSGTPTPDTPQDTQVTLPTVPPLQGPFPEGQTVGERVRENQENVERLNNLGLSLPTTPSD